jgi:hypothetical protein
LQHFLSPINRSTLTINGTIRIELGNPRACRRRSTNLFSKKFVFRGTLGKQRENPYERDRCRYIHRIPMETAEEVLRLYKEVYFDLNMVHFHEKLRDEHEIRLSYTWVQQALQGAGLVTKRRKRGPRRRPRRPMPGMLLHIDGSMHRWLQGTGGTI